MTKNIGIGAVVVAAVLGAVAFFGFSPFIKVIEQFGSPVGATFNTAKFAGITMAPATAAATTSSILNTDASDRLVTGARIACEGVGQSVKPLTGTGIASLTLLISTTSTNAPVSYTPVIPVGQPTVATATPAFVLASTTPALATSSFAAIWTTGTYMTFAFNATNTAVCTVGVDYIGS